MRVFVLGKPREVTHWTEDCLAGFQAAGHETCLGVTRDPRLHPGLERALMADWSGGWLARRQVRAIQAFRPDLILAVRAFATPLPLLARVAALAGRPPLVGWVGDRFSAGDRQVADYFDLIGYTDTTMLARHDALGFRPTRLYLPHAANGRLLDAASGTARPHAEPDVVFVANPTPRRRAIVAAMIHPVALFGPGWTETPGSPHHVTARIVGVPELGGLYARSTAVLNIHHEDNVAAGLNQRHFDPTLFGVPVLSDDLPDLPLCFEPGREVVAWREAEELNALHQRILADPAWATAIGTAAQLRTASTHLYRHRLETVRRAL